MVFRLGKKYQGLVHGVGCACHSPQALQAIARIEAGLSRRAVLRGIAAAFAAPVVAGTSPLFAQPAAPRLLLRNVRIFDGHAPDLIDGRNVLLEGNRIAALPLADETVSDATVIDCQGGTLMPGLIDAHWHSILAGISQLAAMTADIPYVHLVAAQEAERTVLRGFTTVRDVGGPSFSLKRAIDEARTPGPRIFPSGAMVSQTSGHGDFRQRYEVPRSPQTNLSHAEEAGISAIADGVPDVRRRVREQLMLGASQIKIMSGGGVASTHDPVDSLQFSEEETRAAVEAASDWQTYVCAHVYTSQGIQRALKCGVKSIEHGQLADEDTVRMMADMGAWWSIQPFLADEDANVYTNPAQIAQQKLIAKGTVKALELADKHQVNLALGTDILFNPRATATQGRQLAKFARWYDNARVLRLLTGGNAELLGLSGPRSPYQGPLGVIRAGALADLVLLDGNPIENIDLIADPDTHMKLIVKDGRIHKNALAG
jgi:imidazolonepropionase-like amidohydrolase